MNCIYSNVPILTDIIVTYAQCSIHERAFFSVERAKKPIKIIINIIQNARVIFGGDFL